MRRLLLAAALAALLGAAPAHADTWVSAWGAPSTAAFPVSYNMEPATMTGTPGVDRSVRMIARPTLGGSAVRVHLSNAMSSAPLSVGGARVGLRAEGPAVVAGSGRAVTFGGRPGVTIPAGGSAVSDPVALAVAAGRDVAVSLFLAGAAPTPAIHAQAFQTNWTAPSGTGDTTADESGRAFTQPNSSVLVLDRLDVLAPDDAGAVVVLGDSLSDGVGTTVDGHDRWPDDLALRLRDAGVPRAVVDAGMTGNSVDCAVGLDADGPDAVTRFDRDVLGVAGLRTLFLFEGTNDLANACSAQGLITALGGLVARAHARGITVVGATLIPRIDPHFTAQAAADRLVVNRWIRTSGVYDHVIDFDAAVRRAGRRVGSALRQRGSGAPQPRGLPPARRRGGPGCPRPRAGRRGGAGGRRRRSGPRGGWGCRCGRALLPGLRGAPAGAPRGDPGPRADRRPDRRRPARFAHRRAARAAARGAAAGSRPAARPDAAGPGVHPHGRGDAAVRLSRTPGPVTTGAGAPARSLRRSSGPPRHPAPRAGAPRRARASA